MTTTFLVLPSRKLQGNFKILISHACVSGSYRCYWRACWSYIEVTMFLHLRPLLEQAALNRFSFLSKRLHCVKVLLPTALNPELLIVKLELALTITNAVIFNWQNSKRKLCFSIHVIQSHSTCKLREIQLRTQTDLVTHRQLGWKAVRFIPPRGMGGGVYLTKLYSERLRHEAQPLAPIYLYHFWHPFRVSSIEKWYPFQIPT